jgi:hypothetical protein
MAWLAAAVALAATGVPPAAVARTQTVWSRWSGAWEVALDRQPDGGTCLWSTYDAPPPGHARRLSFAVNRCCEVVVVLSDRRQPLHRIAAGPSGLCTLRDRQYAVEIGAGIPLEGPPGGMLVGRVVRRRRKFPLGRPGREVEEAHVLLPGGWSWSVSLRGVRPPRPKTSWRAWQSRPQVVASDADPRSCSHVPLGLAVSRREQTCLKGHGAGVVHPDRIGERASRRQGRRANLPGQATGPLRRPADFSR